MKNKILKDSQTFFQNDEIFNSYMIYWDDMRSSGKEDLSNIYIQSVTLDDSSILLGDLNGDGIINIQDVILIVSNILGNNDFTEDESSQADANSDGTIDVLDIVIIINSILE